MPSSLHVLHVISSLSPLCGGPSVSMHNMLKALRRRGIAAEVVATDDDGGNARLDVPLERLIEIDGESARFFARQTVKYGFSPPMLRWLRAHIHRYDVVHTHGLFSFAPLAGAWHARAAGIPYIMRPAGVLDTWGLKNKSRLVKALSLRLVEGPLLCSAAAVHFTTRLEKERAAELALPIRPVVLPTGMEMETSTGEDSAEPADVSAPDGKRMILYLARIHPIKRVDVLLRAYAALESRESTELVIAGDGEPALLERLKQLACDLGLAQDVRWVGFAEGALKRRLLSRAAVFVLPSASENFGMAVVEAMNAAKPVIVTDGCGLAEFVARHGAGIIVDESVAALRAALADLLASETRRRAMGAAGRAAAQRELSLDAFGARLESLYRSVLNPGPTGAQAKVAALEP